LKTRKWQDEKGMDRYTTEIQCTDFTFLTTKSESQDGDSSNQQQSDTQNQPQQAVNGSIEDNTDDLPF
jgi:single-strand DNA-binding protein